MDDDAIIELYWARDEQAIEQTRRKYGGYCTAIARRIVANREDADECVSDAYLGAWNAIPPHRPQVLGAFLGKITRNLALKKRRAACADRRGGGEVALAIDELGESVPAAGSVTEQVEANDLARAIDSFLAPLDADDRRMFVCRYWHFDSIEQVASRFGFTQSKVKMSLKRTRDRLRGHLEQEGLLS